MIGGVSRSMLLATWDSFATDFVIWCLRYGDGRGAKFDLKLNAALYQRLELEVRLTMWMSGWTATAWDERILLSPVVRERKVSYDNQDSCSRFHVSFVFPLPLSHS